MQSDELNKISSIQLYMLWKNLAIGLLVVILVFTLSKLLPFYFAPVISLVSAAYLYTRIYNSRHGGNTSCMLPVFTIFACLVAYSFVSIVINILHIWNICRFPPEIIFFNKPHVPSLLFNVTSFITVAVIYIRRHHLRICVDCRLERGDSYERGRLGALLSYESHFQLRNLLIVFGVLGMVIWTYYLVFYVKIEPNSRDWYIFTWLTIIAFLLDEVYFAARYYNLYLDLKEHNEIISQDELNDMTAKTYLRYYVVCGNKLYVDTQSIDPRAPYREVIDTPFSTRRSVNGIMVDEVRRIITQMTGQSNGELRFFFGRRNAERKNVSLLRYFYFLDCPPDACPELNAKGEWIDFGELKRIYSHNPGRIAGTALADITRLATIILTEKIFDERGYRKLRLKNYTPTFSLDDVRNSELDFQDDKWIHISLFNSDTPLYSLKKWWRSVTGRKQSGGRQWQ